MIRILILSPEEFFAVFHNTGDRIIFGKNVNTYSKRYDTFLKSLKCYSCNIKGEFFALERFQKTDNPNRFHFNLYGYNGNNTEVLMTKDHIIPKSLGGSDELENLQTMCSKCNNKKGNGFKKPKKKEDPPTIAYDESIIGKAIKKKSNKKFSNKEKIATVEKLTYFIIGNKKYKAVKLQGIEIPIRIDSLTYI